MSATQTQAQWVDCVVDDDYEINVNYPYAIRKKSTGRIVSEHYEREYLRLNLNRNKHYKHDIVALQWIPNDDPIHKTQVDHRNHIGDDNRIENLRWVTPSQNQRNKTSYRGRVVEYVDELSENAFEVTEYNNHEFEDLWFDPETDCFYYFTGAAYREITYSSSKSGALSIRTLDANHVHATISLNKFKRVYELI